MVAKKTGYSHKIDFLSTSFTKIIKMDFKDLNIKPDATKLLEENSGE